MTKQKKLIYEILSKSHSHLTANEIYMKAREEMPSIALGTVYRNLKLLSDDNYIMPIEVSDGPVRYDGNPIHHDHIICKKCGEMSDICDLSSHLKSALDVDIISYDCTIYYICDKCKKEKGVDNYES